MWEVVWELRATGRIVIVEVPVIKFLTLETAPLRSVSSRGARDGSFCLFPFVCLIYDEQEHVLLH